MYPRFVLKGNPYEIGFMHGSLAREEVIRNVENYKVIFREMGGVTWEEVSRDVDKFIPAIERFDAGILEEIQGIATGAGLDFRSILTLNARSELLMTPKMLEVMGECTTFGVLPERTQNETFIGQNWDFPVSQRDVSIILEIEQEDKPKILMVTEAGIVGKTGMNSNGLGICLNAIVTDRQKAGTPLHIVMRGFLNSPDFHQGLSVLVNSDIASACNFLVGQHDAYIASMEMIPDDFEILFPENGFILHTNHLSHRLLAKVDDIGRRRNPCTFTRLYRGSELFSKADIIDLPTLKKIQSDHVGYPHSICKHIDLANPVKSCSVFAVVMDLKNTVLYITPGQPCTTDYEKLTFSSG